MTAAAVDLRRPSPVRPTRPGCRRQGSRGDTTCRRCCDPSSVPRSSISLLSAGPADRPALACRSLGGGGYDRNGHARPVRARAPCRHRRRRFRRPHRRQGAEARSPSASRSSIARTTTCSRCCSTRWRPPACRPATSPRRSAGSCAARTNARVLMADAQRVDVAAKALITDVGPIAFDYLILAPGVTHSYFGHDEWRAACPGAQDARRRAGDPLADADGLRAGRAGGVGDERRRWLTFVIVGGGPTGVELAGAIVEIARHALRHEFRAIDSRTARVLLLEGGPDAAAGVPAGAPRSRAAGSRAARRHGADRRHGRSDRARRRPRRRRAPGGRHDPVGRRGAGVAARRHAGRAARSRGAREGRARSVGARRAVDLRRRRSGDARRAARAPAARRRAGRDPGGASRGRGDRGRSRRPSARRRSAIAIPATSRPSAAPRPSPISAGSASPDSSPGCSGCSCTSSS